jgi:hypothetical protein
MKSDEHLIPIKPFRDGKKRHYLVVKVFYDRNTYTPRVTHVDDPAGLTKGPGIWISVYPLTIEESDTPGLVWRTSGPWTGYKKHLEDAKRLNRKRVTAVFDQAVAEIEAKDGKAWDVVKYVLDYNGGEIETSPEELEVPCT